MKYTQRVSQAFLAGICALGVFFLVGGCGKTHADNDHDHNQKITEEGNHDLHKKATKEMAHDHHDEATEEQDHHGHNEEGEPKGNPSVGPKKGITEINEKDGFKISKEAYQNFDIQTVTLKKDSTTWEIPLKAVLYSGDEVNVFRLRQGFYKRVDFIPLSKTRTEIKIKSADLQAGDEVVFQGHAFLRSVEIVATGGAPHGHSH